MSNFHKTAAYARGVVMVMRLFEAPGSIPALPAGDFIEDLVSHLGELSWLVIVVIFVFAEFLVF